MVQTAIAESSNCSISTSSLSTGWFLQKQIIWWSFGYKTTIRDQPLWRERKEAGLGRKRIWSVTQAKGAPVNLAGREPITVTPWGGTGIPPNPASLSHRMWTVLGGAMGWAGQLSVAEAGVEGAHSCLLRHSLWLARSPSLKGHLSVHHITLAVHSIPLRLSSVFLWWLKMLLCSWAIWVSSFV